MNFYVASGEVNGPKINGKLHPVRGTGRPCAALIAIVAVMTTATVADKMMRFISYRPSSSGE